MSPFRSISIISKSRFSRRISRRVNSVGIHREVVNEILRQFVSLTRGLFVPVCELRRNNYHFLVKLRPRAEAVSLDIASRGSLAEPHSVVTRHCHHHREFARSVIVFGKIADKYRVVFSEIVYVARKLGTRS